MRPPNTFNLHSSIHNNPTQECRFHDDPTDERRLQTPQATVNEESDEEGRQITNWHRPRKTTSDPDSPTLERAAVVDNFQKSKDTLATIKERIQGLLVVSVCISLLSGH